ncbi:hypothetical protein [Marinospirillum sp.]|uniref:hypothetical protein n=1 Tax=Marinospirillum sp. TaxID=2183934 RepID=UPI002870A7AE|nr:hypothetical protein [Marinospirillum sp.]MDR9468969.1 hypothetical protein [Marinospirillum sp.]
MMNHTINSVIKPLIAKSLTLIFLGLAGGSILSLVVNIVYGIINGSNAIDIFLQSINTAIIALAVFELALVINKEYSDSMEKEDAVTSLRKTLPRFIGMVCVALSLEGLIMVIKYSQLELAGNLYYPVAIICSTALLLMALSIFLYLTSEKLKTTHRSLDAVTPQSG